MKNFVTIVLILSIVILSGCRLFGNKDTEELHWCTTPTEETK